MPKHQTLLLSIVAIFALCAYDCHVRADGPRPYEGLTVGWDQRPAVPLDPAGSPLLPQADSAQSHDIPTGVSPTTAKLQDWIFFLASNPNVVSTQQNFANGTGVSSNVETFSTSSLVASTSIYKNIPDVHTGDRILARIGFIASGDFGGDTTSFTELRLFAHRGGGGPTIGSDIALNGAKAWLCANSDFVNVFFEGMFTAAATEEVTIYLAGATPSGSITIHNVSLVVQQLRPASIPAP